MFHGLHRVSMNLFVSLVRLVGANGKLKGIAMKKRLVLLMLALPAISWGYCEQEKAQLQTAQESLIKCERGSYNSSQMCAGNRAEKEKAQTELYLCEQVNAPKNPSPPSACGELAAIKSEAIQNIQPGFIYCRDKLKKFKSACIEFACKPYYEASNNYSNCLKENKISRPNQRVDLCARFRVNKEYSPRDTIGGY